MSSDPAPKQPLGDMPSKTIEGSKRHPKLGPNLYLAGMEPSGTVLIVEDVSSPLRHLPSMFVSGVLHGGGLGDSDDDAPIPHGLQISNRKRRVPDSTDSSGAEDGSAAASVQALNQKVVTVDAATQTEGSHTRPPKIPGLLPESQEMPEGSVTGQELNRFGIVSRALPQYTHIT